MPTTLFFAFIASSTGLTALAFASIAFARKPTRSGAAFFLVSTAFWLLTLEIAIKGFSWQTGAALHPWFTRFSLITERMCWILVPLAGVALALPRGKALKPSPVTAIAFAVSALLSACGVSGAFGVPASLTAFMLAEPETIWAAGFASIAVAAFAELVFDSESLGAEGSIPTVAAFASIVPIVAGVPVTFSPFPPHAERLILAGSGMLSLATFVSAAILSRKKSGKDPANQANVIRPETHGREPLAERGMALGETGISHDSTIVRKAQTQAQWRLSARENEIASLLSEGKTNGEIAETLFISQKTVETHIYNIFRKVGVSNRVQLARALLYRMQEEPQ